MELTTAAAAHLVGGTSSVVVEVKLQEGAANLKPPQQHQMLADWN